MAQQPDLPRPSSSRVSSLSSPDTRTRSVFSSMVKGSSSCCRPAKSPKVEAEAGHGPCPFFWGFQLILKHFHGPWLSPTCVFPSWFPTFLTFGPHPNSEATALCTLYNYLTGSHGTSSICKKIVLKIIFYVSRLDGPQTLLNCGNQWSWECYPERFACTCGSNST